MCTLRPRHPVVEEHVSARVLIVDDNEVFRRPLQRTLEAAGYEVVAVPSGEDALDVLDRSTVDVVLTDRRLPGMDGVHLTRRIKAIHPAVAIIVMTAYGTIESAVEARRYGADDYLVKPFEMPDLLLALHRALEQQQSPARTASAGEPWPT
jgi:DNA-binding NtrC family response regulator